MATGAPVLSRSELIEHAVLHDNARVQCWERAAARRRARASVRRAFPRTLNQQVAAASAATGHALRDGTRKRPTPLVKS